MSNPLTNLKKSRKAPLPNHGRIGSPTGRNVPYKNYTQSESQMLGEITANMAAERLKDVDRLPKLRDSTGPASNGSSPRSNASGSSNDQELMSLMMARLGQLEQKLQFRSKELAESEKKVRILEDKVRILHKARDNNDPGRVQEMEKKCLFLQQQVHDMESFLADYGMVWVGSSSEATKRSDVYNSDAYEELGMTGEDSDPEESSFTRGQVHKTLWNPAESLSPEFKVDFDLVVKNINDLNELAGAGLAKIQHTTDGARLKRPDHIPLTLFANGVLMFRGPFRPFTDRETRQCVSDIMDGFFPSELQIRYPDGVPFTVTDRREVHYKDRLGQIFEGEAQLLGGEAKPSRLVPSNLDKGRSKSKATQSHESSSRDETSQIPGRQMTMEQFLNKLPASVLKDGKVIDIRKSVGGQLSGSHGPNAVTVVETAVVKDFKDKRLREQVSPRPSAHKELTTLRVKDEGGNHTYILKMQYTETLADVRAYLDRLRPKGSPQYQIVSTFPRQVYSDMSKTLVEAKLVPNATLHLQVAKSR